MPDLDGGGGLYSGGGYGVECASVATAYVGVAIVRYMGPICGRRPKAQAANPRSHVGGTFLGGDNV